MFEKLKHKLRYKIYRFSYNNAHLIKPNVPVDVSLELSSACNQRCGYCYHADQKNLPFKIGMMEFSLAKSIIDQAAALEVNSLKFNQKGEATLNPHFKNITEWAKRHARGMTFIDRITNSNFKFRTDNDDIFEGLCNQTKVKVSFDSFNPKVMETQRAGSIHELALRNIDKFYNYPLRNDTQLVIQAVRTKLNKDEDIEGEVKKRWSSALVSVRDMVGGRVNSDTVTTLENVSRENRERQTCIQAHGRLILNYEGKALVCCPDIGEKLVIGDAKKDSLYTIFNSPAAKKIRDDLLNGKAFENDPCKTCSSHESYKGYKHNKDS
jgi:MoaA/NifB/PqqE/SkfB family radical SAM enzyme